MRKLIKLQDNMARGIYYTMVGQKVEAWLPKGMYRLDRIKGESVVIERCVPSGWASYEIHPKVAANLGFVND